MARTKNPLDTAAVEGAPDPAPASGSPAAAVRAALAASPGATTAVIAAASGTDRRAARDVLLAMEAAGAATRARGAKPGIPDTWTLAGTGSASGYTAPLREDEQDKPHADEDDQDEPAGDEDKAAAGSTAHDDSAGPVSQQRPSDGAGPHPGVPPSLAAPPRDGTASGDRPGAVPGDQDAEPVPHDEATADSSGQQGQDAGPADGDGGTADGGGGTGDPPDPALVTEITERLGQIKAAADAAGIALTASGDLGTVLAGLDEIAGQAGHACRSLKAAIGGRRAPGARPGALRERVLAHLRSHPGKEFTPHDIHKVLGNSSGAIANAMDTLATHGDAEVACDKPRRFRLARSAAGSGSPGGGSGGGTELAGAA